MKKVVMKMGAFFALSVATAQGGYASLSVGYAGGSSNVIGSSYEELTEGMLDADFNWIPGTSKTTTINGTFGQGIPINLAGGFMFNEHIGAELGLTYLMGSTITTSESTYLDGSNSTTSTKGSQLRILPQLVISSGSASALEVYAKGGLLLPVSGSTTYKIDRLKSNGKTAVTEGTSTGKFSLGLTGTVGAAYGISDNLSVFGELQGAGLSIKTDKMTMTSYVDEGQELIGDIPVQSKETEFVDEVLSGDNDLDTEPYTTTTQSSNYNSLGFNLGIRFKF